MIFEAVDLFDLLCRFIVSRYFCSLYSGFVETQKKRRDEGVEELPKKLINVAL